MRLSRQRLHVHSSLHAWKWGGSLKSDIHSTERTSVRKKVENSSWNVLTVMSVPGQTLHSP